MKVNEFESEALDTVFEVLEESLIKLSEVQPEEALKLYSKLTKVLLPRVKPSIIDLNQLNK